MIIGFHGRTLATMSASYKPQWKDLFETRVPGFVKAPLASNEFKTSSTSRTGRSGKTRTLFFPMAHPS
jgi:acetylornithine/succinyldiaminopimelate/putrescine aminotransferase